MARRLLVLVLGVALQAAAQPATPDVLVESARSVPVAARADVVVVGGTTGAVAAAVEAARGGARVVLAAPGPYLGEDMAATLRLWLEPGEDPGTDDLAKAIFAPEAWRGHEARPESLPFTYAASLPSSPRHADTPERTRLRDGRWHRASSDSVQYDGDVTVTLDLGEPTPVAAVDAMVFHRADYSLASMEVAWSADGAVWHDLGTAVNPHPAQTGPESAADPVGFPIGQTARLLRLGFRCATESTRILLGEILVRRAGEGQETADATRAAIRPLHLKRTLDDALLAAGVQFFYTSPVAGVVRRADGTLAGVVIANRAGRQALLGKVFIDATERALVAEAAGAAAEPLRAGTHVFRRTVIGGEARTLFDGSVRTIEPPLQVKGVSYPVFEYTLRLALGSPGWAAWMAVEHQARTLTYHPEQQFAAERLFLVPPDPLRCVAALDGPWPGASAVSLEVFQPRQCPRLFVLGGRAALSRDAAGSLLRPLNLMAVGRRLGAAAAELARGTPPPIPAPAPAETVGLAALDTREILDGPRPFLAWERLPLPPEPLPVLGSWDVVVVGGGTSGAPAAIAAARQGASTLLLEVQHSLGGVGTLGAIASYYHGYRGGFTAEVPGGSSWKVEPKAEWWRTAALAAGADVWFGALGCGAVQSGNRVRGVVVVTPRGRGVVLAGAVIDATGNADIAAAAGAACIIGDDTGIAVQGTGLPPRNLGVSHTNTDFTLVDETDLVDVTALYVYAKRKYAATTFDQGLLIDTRERRRIVGEFTVTVADQVMGRTYPDTVLMSRTNYDTHGYTVDPFFQLEETPSRQRFETYLPYRSLLPKGLEGILVTGLGVSVHRDAQPLVRMQPDLQNLGYACGVAAAMSRTCEGVLRRLDVKALQQHLVEKQCLPAEVLAHGDSCPVPRARLEEAVAKAGREYGHTAVLLAHRDQALPLVRAAWEACEPGEMRLFQAHLLTLLGDAAGVGDLVDEVARQADWGPGWNYRAMGQFGGSQSLLDARVLALGRSRDPRALEPILRLTARLDAEVDFSHHRAAALALEALADPRAAAVLATVLRKPGMAGHVLRDVAAAIEGHTTVDASLTALRPRRHSLRELYLARALYRCGDVDGLGEGILRAYTEDVRGHFARHAAAALADRQGSSVGPAADRPKP